MTPVELNELINFYCGTNDGNFPPAKKLILINIFKNDIAAEIAKRNEDYFGMIFKKNLEAGRREYGLPDEILNNIKGVEAMIDGNGWSWLREFDINSLKRPTNEANIIEIFTGKEPMFDIFRRSLWIYSGTAIIDVVEGLKLWAIIYPADIPNLTSTTDMSVDPTETTHGFPRQFHELLGRRVSIAYKNSLDRPKTLSEKELKYDVDLERALNAITGMNLDRSVIASVPKDNGQDY